MEQKIYTAQELSIKSLDELKAISTQLGKVPHHAAKEQKVIEGILMAQDAVRPFRDPNVAQTGETDQDAPTAPVERKKYQNTPEEVTEAIASFRPEGMIAKFHDNCFHFEYRGRVDTGTLSQPLSHIVKLARLVSRGGRLPPKVTINGDKILGA